jgi:predicted dehydrogenase
MRVGMIGTGYWAREVHGASVAQHPRVDFVGVWGRDPAATSAVAVEFETRAFSNLDQLIDAVDALTFAVPPDVQADIATRAAARGRHLLLEKPIATSVLEALRLERAVADAGVASVVFFTRRFVPETQIWLQRIADVGGWECGRAELASAVFVPGNPFAHSAWRREKGALWDIGPHALSLLVPVLGDVTNVIAGAGRRDQVHLIMQHTEGRSSTASLSMTVPEAATGSTLYVYGPGGRMTAPGSFELPRVVAAHHAALDALIDQAAQPGSGHPCDVRFGARVVEILAAAEQALASGRRVEVESSQDSVLRTAEISS